MNQPLIIINDAVLSRATILYRTTHDDEHIENLASVCPIPNADITARYEWAEFKLASTCLAHACKLGYETWRLAEKNEKYVYVARLIVRKYDADRANESGQA
ncbi:hypothetical protein [Glutamicibacter ardleyensis]|uniref:Uncharacterized protein n=1 Tax=Glutamicibacter ardleyensis TaxID=225894 RepID=A0ABQ2DFQ3_9MICC|nr:hypothetical protein [Glutamicibacter ardleyensis]GGJ56177.1 hypothetical protein GCM10007173_13720 [Glutamicibacter ardleyensis]